MLTVDFRGQLGNQMFEYSFGRIVADQFGMKFVSPKIPMFPDLVTELSGFEYDHGTITVEQDSKHPVLLSPWDVETRCRGFNILLRGYFESSVHYIEHRERIRTWFKLPERAAIKDSVAIHVRGTDAEPWRLPPVDYYRKAIKAVGNYTQFVIYSDDFNTETVAAIIEMVGIGMSAQKDSSENDFINLSRHSRIIIGNSTFAWWAAFLSRATTIIQPEPINGWRSPEYPNSCLRVPEWVGIKYENTNT